MKKIIEGLSKFQDEVFPQHQELFSELASGQRPEALLITCSDSRIDPTLLTQTRPGDLFIIRNAGNIVPAFGHGVGGVTATIEYAVLALDVRDIILCGHSNCGVMTALLHPEKVAAMRNVASWLHYGETARLVVEHNYSHLSESDRLMVLTEQNVIAQLNNLRTHPAIAARLAKGSLKLHGWVYEIGTGNVTAFDAETETFMPLRQLTSLVGATR